MIMRDRSLRQQFAWLCEKKQKQKAFNTQEKAGLGNRTESLFTIRLKKTRRYRASQFRTSSHISLFKPHFHCEHISFNTWIFFPA